MQNACYNILCKQILLFFFPFMMSFLSPADPPNKDNKPRILEVNFYFVFF